MSFNQPRLERPFSKTLEWKSQAKKWTYYDKDAGGNIDFPLDRFIVLEELNSVTGYSEEHRKGVWSNEVLNMAEEPLTVKAGGHVIAQGIYKEIREQIMGAGGKYCKVLYALIPATGEIVRILLYGSSFSAWLDKGFAPMSKGCGVQYSGTKEGQNGAVRFNSPVFVQSDLTAGEFEAATKACGELLSWIDARNKQGESENEQRQADDANAQFQEAAQPVAHDVQGITEQTILALYEAASECAFEGGNAFSTMDLFESWMELGAGKPLRQMSEDKALQTLTWLTANPVVDQWPGNVLANYKQLATPATSVDVPF